MICGPQADFVDLGLEPDESPDGFADLAEDPCDVLVRTHVTFGHERARDRLCQLAHALLDACSLVRERELGPGVRESLRDRPGDRPLVRPP